MEKAHLVPVRIEKSAQVNYVGMGYESHYLKFAILEKW